MKYQDNLGVDKKDQIADRLQENLRCFRRKMRLSQSELIRHFLSDNSGKFSISVSKLSTLENRGGPDLELICRTIAEKISGDPDLFELPTEDFSRSVEDCIREMQIGKSGGLQRIAVSADQSSELEILIRLMNDYFTDAIMSGELKPGDKIPSERNLVSMFNSSRTSVREALKVLSILGLIDIIPGQGMFISSSSSSFFLTPLSWAFFMSELDIDDVIRVRNLLEIESVRLAAEDARPGDLENLKYIFERSNIAYRNGDLASFLDLDIDFHLAISLCSRNHVIYHLLATIRKLIRTISKRAMMDVKQLSSIHDEHISIFNAIMEQNPEDAQYYMTTHLHRLAERYETNKGLDR